MVILMLMTSCASVNHTEKLAKYKELTKDICKDRPNEIKLAQQLYISYVLEQ